jgi:soluble lytic murein transglycosylase
VVACGGGEALSEGVTIVPLTQEPPGSETPATTEEPTAVATPTLSLTPPRNAPADLAKAILLEAEGALEGALASYLAVAASRDSSRGEGVLGAARVLLELDRPQEARRLLEPFLAGGAGAETGAAHYLLARTFAALGLVTQSLEQYDLYLAGNGPAAPYAHIDKARLLAQSGQAAAAAAEAEAALSLTLPVAMRRAFIYTVAESHEMAGALGDALAWYRAFREAGGDEVVALASIAAVKQELGDPTFRDETQRLMAAFPASQQARKALSDTLARGESVDSYVRGLILYRHNEYDRALEAFNERINAAPNAASSAETYYYASAILESRGQMAEALDYYARVLALNPGSHLADDALWWRGRILEDQGRHGEAAAEYAQLLAGYPGSPWAPDAAFRRGMLSYRANDFAGAANIWADGLSLVTGVFQRQRLSLWQGKALLKAGDNDGARVILERLAAEGEDDYYGVRALSLLGGRHNQPKAVVEANVNLTPSFDWDAAEAWLAQWTGRAVGPASSQAWFSDPRWLRAHELWRVGRASQGDSEVFDLIEAHARDAVAMYTMARTLAAEGRMAMSARAGQRLLRVLNLNPNEGLPKALLSLSYPAAFPTNVQRYAQAERISPLLMLAFIRQESFFDPRAISPVGALGLTQVLPSTGRILAQELGVARFEPDHLLQTELNIRFGASYMAARLREFDNNIFVALAAYNAGPNAARRWIAASSGDADLYVETVEFRETRMYIEIVAENYAIYRYLYGGSRVPDLPRD